MYDYTETDHKIIWHYTDFRALDGILIKGELRLCNTKGMNDKKEILGFVMGIEDALCHKYPGDAVQIRRVFQEQIEKRENENIYGSSFSYLCNDAAQWERYGNAGYGVSIGFDMELLRKISEPYLLEEVSYQKDYRNYDFMGLTNQHEEIGKAVLAGDADTIFRNIWACSGAYKDYSFKSEQEIRLMTQPIDPVPGDKRQRGIYGEIEYDVMREKIREYMVFHLRKRCERFQINFEDLITGIIIGPKSSQSKAVLKNYLLKNGLERIAAAVSISDCPLR